MTATDTTGVDPDAPYQLFIGGERVAGGNGTYAIVNPATEEVVGHAPDATAADAEAAAEAAAAAFPAWSRTTPEHRAELLSKAADLLEDFASGVYFVPLAAILHAQGDDERAMAL